jgi:hypothetical protein
MNRLSGSIVFLMLVVVTAAFSGTPGSFRGFLMEGADTKPGWMYVQSRNDMLRLVKVSGAAVSYSDSIPVELRRANPRESLRPGAEVRVLAEQDRRGAWRAREIEILRLAPLRNPQVAQSEKEL